MYIHIGLHALPIYHPIECQSGNEFPALSLLSLVPKLYMLFVCMYSTSSFQPLDHANDEASSIIEYAMKLGELGMTLRHNISISLLHLTACLGFILQFTST